MVRGRVRILMAAVAVAGIVAVFGAAPAFADSPSDSRSTAQNGNVTTCSGVNLGTDTQVGADSGGASDSNVAGLVKPNGGPVQRGQGQELDVSLSGSDIVIDAIVVKGGNGYNTYSNPAYLPPAAQPDQHYISPYNNGGNVPDISHWFVCYHASGTALPVGAAGGIGLGVVAGAALALSLARHRREGEPSTAA